VEIPVEEEGRSELRNFTLKIKNKHGKIKLKTLSTDLVRYGEFLLLIPDVS
jgi:hypothetical protein